MIDEIWAYHMIHKTSPSREFEGFVSDLNFTLLDDIYKADDS